MDATILERIRSRKIVQWGIAYGAAAWLILQVLDVVSDPWAIPAWTVRVVQVVLGTGFLITLVLAWYHGDRGRQRASGAELLLVLGLIALGTAVAMQFGPGDDLRALAETEREGATSSAEDDEGGPELRRRLAVLPLTNNTGDASVQHIVDGLHEAIIYRLGTIRSLDPVSRTSVMGYREAPASAREIARQLDVGWILEGSFTWATDSVRLTLRLVDAQRDAEEWSERFEGELGDLMQLEDQIARQVARGLRAHLTPREDSLLAFSPRIDARAGDAYLRARAAGTRAEAISFLTDAIRLDPGFAAPYGELARLYGELAFGGRNTPETASELYDRVVRLAEQGLQLDSGMVSAYTALAEVRYHRDWDWAAGLALFERAVEINPSYSVVHMRISGHQAALGRVEAAIRAAREAQRADPRWPFAWSGLAYNLLRLGEYELALSEADAGLQRTPDNAGLLRTRGQALSRLGRHEEVLETLRSDGDSVALAVALTLAGRRQEAVPIRDALADSSRTSATSPYDLARLFALTDEKERAIEHLQRAAAQRVGSVMWLSVDPDLAGIRDDPRVQELMTAMRFPPVQSPRRNESRPPRAR